MSTVSSPNNLHGSSLSLRGEVLSPRVYASPAKGASGHTDNAITWRRPNDNRQRRHLEVSRVAGSRVRDHESEARQGQITEELLMLFQCDKKTLKLPCAILMPLPVSPCLPGCVFWELLGQHVFGSPDLRILSHRTFQPIVLQFPWALRWTSFRLARTCLQLLAFWLKILRLITQSWLPVWNTLGTNRPKWTEYRKYPFYTGSIIILPL